MNSEFRALRKFFQTGNTLSYDFRIKQLKKLRTSIEKYEDDILTALKVDMRKPEYEAYTSEIGLIYQELKDAIDNLDDWMAKKKLPTPLYLKPASSYILPVPKGVVLIISPWNYPFLLSFSPMVAAIASGNCVMVKPSSKSSYSSKLITRIIEESFEPDYIRAINCRGEEIPKLVKLADFDHIFFTGSQEVGRSLAGLAGSKLCPITLELGGKSPTIVDETTDLRLAAKKITWAKFLNLGQTCIAPDYILVKEDIMEDFIASVQDHIRAFYGDNIMENPDYGRIIDLESFKRLQALLEDSQLIFGGDTREEDLFIGPSLILADLDSPLMKEEIFGPLMPLISYRENIEILDIINLNPNPLALYLFTEDEALVEYIMNGVAFGGGCINDTISHMVNTNLPFGGLRESGQGNYHSIYGFREFSHFKSLLHSTKNMDIDIKYPPYTRTKKNLSKFFLK